MATRKSSGMSRQEAGRRGAEARWGKSSGHSGNNRSGNIGRQSQVRAGTSRKQVAQRGGRALAEEYGPNFYREIGRRGGEAVLEDYGPEFYREIGRRGGLARWGEDYEDENEEEGYRRRSQGYGGRQQAGRRGGEAVREEYDPEFYREIGRRRGQARWDEAFDEDENEEEEGYTHLGQGLSRQQAGRRGSLARWGEGYDEDEEEKGYTHRGQGHGRQQAGRRSGEAVREEYGPEFYREIGRKGGQARRRTR